VQQTYSHVIVDEFQDLTPGEQKLFFRLRGKNGKFVALGDPRQSIYRFRGNEKDGLAKLRGLAGPDNTVEVKDIAMTECRRCPAEIVRAANQLMGLYDAQRMTSGSEVSANLHVVFWKSIEAEARGMAAAIVDNIHAHPQDPNSEHLMHLAMVTRRQFGYQLREEIRELDPQLSIALGFSEGLLEAWAVREAFLFFCLLVDPDAPTWRAWLGYQNSVDGTGFKAPKRNADAYLRFLTACNDHIDEAMIRQLASSSKKPPGTGGSNLQERAKRYVELRDGLQCADGDAIGLLKAVFDITQWGVNQSSDAETAKHDMEEILSKASDIYQELDSSDSGFTLQECLRQTAQRLRYQIATREPFVSEEVSDLQITTLWGGKGITAEHVYVIGLCKEAIPGTRREDYPGTDLDYEEEQRRLFYVSITRSKRTLVLSRARWIPKGKTGPLGLAVKDGSSHLIELEMTPFLRDVINFLPQAVDGDSWEGCL
jgi:DNA helicase-2/ATP-dependent DNA helicase PcrA